MSPIYLLIVKIVFTQSVLFIFFNLLLFQPKTYTVHYENIADQVIVA